MTRTSYLVPLANDTFLLQINIDLTKNHTIYPGTGNNSQFTYDPFSRNVKILEYMSGTLTSTRQFIWSENDSERDEVHEMRDSSGTVISQYFGYGQTISGSSYFYTRDHLNSVREMTQSTMQAEYDYSPYGLPAELQGSATSDMQFCGLYQHAQSGLNLATYRAYNSKVGRWMNRDPIGEEGGINEYSYALNSPIDFKDITGLKGTGGLSNPFGRGPVDPENPFIDPSWPICVPSASTDPWNTGVSTDPANPTPTNGEDPPGAHGLPPKLCVGKDGNDNCKPCPPDTYWSHPGPGHGGVLIHYHGTKWNQNPKTCECFPFRVGGPTPYNMR